MSQLDRVTTQYIATEDRMKLSGELGTGEIVVLWLNQRLLLRLLPHLFRWLENQDDTNIPSEIIQSFSQQAATAEISTEPEVIGTETTLEWLVNEIDITPDEKSFVMRFKGDATQESVLPFTNRQLRQWLSILYKLWCLAEWPASLWPQWIVSSTKQESATFSETNLH